MFCRWLKFEHVRYSIFCLFGKMQGQNRNKSTFSSYRAMASVSHASRVQTCDSKKSQMDQQHFALLEKHSNFFIMRIVLVLFLHFCNSHKVRKCRKSVHLFTKTSLVRCKIWKKVAKIALCEPHFLLVKYQAKVGKMQTKKLQTAMQNAK